MQISVLAQCIGCPGNSFPAFSTHSAWMDRTFAVGDRAIRNSASCTGALAYGIDGIFRDAFEHPGHPISRKRIQQDPLDQPSLPTRPRRLAIKVASARELTLSLR